MWATSSAWMTADFADVAEQRELAPLLLGDRAVGAHEEDVGCDADRAQLLDRVLGRLGLQLAGRRDVGHQGQVHVDRLSARQVVAELADGLQERHGLDVADGAADLAQHEVELFIAARDERLDLVRDVGNDLHRGAQIVAAPLLLDDVLVDAAGGDVVFLVRRAAGEALVMAEVEIGLRAIVRHENLSMLIGRHGAGVDVEVGIELANPNAIATRLQERAKGRCRDAFSE